jgi:hypothetical protein
MVRRFRQTLLRLGCDHFEVYEQVGSNWSNSESTGRYVQILRFTDRKHQLAVQAAERNDPTAQAVIAEFCDLINFPYQQQQGLFAVGFYTSVLPVTPRSGTRGELEPTVEHEVVEDELLEGPQDGAATPEQAATHAEEGAGDLEAFKDDDTLDTAADDRGEQAFVEGERVEPASQTKGDESSQH